MMNINHKYFLLTIIVIAVSILFILPARVFAESSSTTYEAQIITTSSAGVFTVTSSTYDGQGSIGQLVIGTAGSSASGEGALGLDLGLGFLWVAGGGLAVTPQEYDIYDLKAYSYATKEEIPASTWQKRNDPYFTWKMKIAYENTVVFGYSVAIDAEPDEIIDTKDLSYSGFIYPPIADGKHTFSVKAATTGGLWGET